MRTLYACALSAILLMVAAWAGAQSTEFTYQGELSANGSPVSDPAMPISFQLFDDPVAGNALGAISNQNVNVQNGRFTATLDFGAVWSGADRWLQITVNGIALSPRTKISRAPYAVTSGSTLALRERPLSPAPPANGQVLKWDGASWAPAPDLRDQYWLANGNNLFYPTGFVGIGTSTPNRPLTIQGANLGGTSQLLQFRDRFGVDRWHFNITSGLNLAETNVADNRIFIAPGGNVGIGTANPQTRLEVAGPIRAPIIQLFSGGAAAGRVLTSDANGNASWQSLPSSASAWTVNGNAIFNSNNGPVGINTGAPVGYLDVQGAISQGEGQLDQQQFVANGRVGMATLWQSFTAGATGVLARLEVQVLLFNPTPAVLNIYQGEGDGGPLLSTQNITLQATGGFQSWLIANPPIVTAGQVYTYRISLGGNPGTWADSNNANPYSGGRSSFNPSWDLLFRTFVAPLSTGTALRVAEGGFVTVGGRLETNAFRLMDGATANRVLTSDAVGIGTWQLVSSPMLASDAASLNRVSGGAMASSGGNVGVGTNNPAARLDVAGTVRATGLQVTTGAASGRVLVSDAQGNATWQLGAGGGLKGMQEYTAPGSFNWVAPAGVNAVLIELVGAGGGGGGNNINNYFGGSGAAGAYVQSIVPVEPGQTYRIVVGTGGAAGGNGQFGQAGAASQFVRVSDNAVLLSAGGGGGGRGATFNDPDAVGGVPDPNAAIRRAGPNGTRNWPDLGSGIQGPTAIVPFPGAGRGGAGGFNNSLAGAGGHGHAIIRF